MSLNQLTRSDRTCAVYDTSGQELDGCAHQQVQDPIEWFLDKHDVLTSKRAVKRLDDANLSSVVIDSNVLPCKDCLDVGGIGAAQVSQFATIALQEQLRRNRVRDLGEPEPYQILKQTTIAVKFWWRVHHPSPK